MSDSKVRQWCRDFEARRTDVQIPAPLLSLMKASPYTLLIRRWISAALHPSAWRNLITARTSYLAGDPTVLGMFTCSLRAQNWPVRSEVNDGHTRGIEQHLCAKRHLIFTVVLISRPMGPWKQIAYVIHCIKRSTRNRIARIKIIQKLLTLRDPFHWSFLSVDVHGLALALLVADITQGLRDSSCKFNLIFYRWMEAWLVETWRCEHFSWNTLFCLITCWNGILRYLCSTCVIK